MTRQNEKVMRESLRVGYGLAENVAVLAYNAFNDRRPTAAETAAIEDRCEFGPSLEKLRKLLGAVADTEEVADALHDLSNACVNDLATYEDRGFFAGFAAGRGIASGR